MKKMGEILIVEDSLTQAIKLQDILEKKRYEVFMARNGKDAVEYLENNSLPDLVISDVMMPDMNGYELCNYIKTSDELKSIPVILLTSMSEPEYIMKGLEMGANNFITKPYEEKYLLSRIEYVLLNDKLRKNISTEMGLEVFFAGKKYFLNSDRLQIFDLLISTFESVIHKNKELEKTNKELMRMNNELEKKVKEIEKLQK